MLKRDFNVANDCTNYSNVIQLIDLHSPLSLTLQQLKTLL